MVPNPNVIPSASVISATCVLCVINSAENRPFCPVELPAFVLALARDALGGSHLQRLRTA